MEIYGLSHPLLRRIWKLRQFVPINGKTVALPTVEACFTLRAWSMRRKDRDLLDKYMDAHDLYLLVQRFPRLDEDTLCALWELVYPGNGSEILRVFSDARCERRLKF